MQQGLGADGNSDQIAEYYSAVASENQPSEAGLAALNNGLSQPPRLSLNASLQTAAANVFFLFSSAPNLDAPIQPHTTQYSHLSFPAPYFTRRTLIQLSTIRY